MTSKEDIRVIGKEELIQKLSNLFILNFIDEEQYKKTYSELMAYLGKNYMDFDEEARNLSDDFCQASLKVVQQNVDSMPAGEEKEQLAQMLGASKGIAYSSRRLVEILDTNPHGEIPIHKDTRRIFLARLQDVLDLLSKIREQPHSNADGFAKVSLFHSCVDEFLAAFHLSQRNYYNQAYTHLRTIIECVDKAILFNEQPEWTEIWSSSKEQDKKTAREKLSPSGVRRILNRDSYDPVYGFMSAMGPHGTFRSIQSRSSKLSETPGEPRPKIMTYIGGCPFAHEVVLINFCLVYMLFHYLLNLTIVYASHLDEAKIVSALTVAFNDVEFMLRTHFIPSAEKDGVDVSELVDSLNSLPKSFESRLRK